MEIFSCDHQADNPGQARCVCSDSGERLQRCIATRECTLDMLSSLQIAQTYLKVRSSDKPKQLNEEQEITLCTHSKCYAFLFRENSVFELRGPAVPPSSCSTHCQLSGM